MKENEPTHGAGAELPEDEALTAKELESHLLKQLADSGGEDRRVLWELCRFYSQTRRQPVARTYLERLLKKPCELEERAGYIFALGQLAEQVRDYSSAAVYYRQALSMEPCDKKTWYFIHNNLGFSLNQMKQFEEAVRRLKAAIDIDASYSNAHKNLGLSYQGLGRYAEAAECFIEATRVNASDGRSLNHLEDLLREHPELLTNRESLQTELDACREAVDAAKKSTA